MNSLIVILFAAIVVIGIVLLVIITTTRKSPKGLNKDQFQKKWLEIEHSLDASESSRHLCVLKADKLLDAAFKARGFKGETMGERLKNAQATLSNRNAVWAAHKLRNQVAHEPDVEIKPKSAQLALSAFKKALQDVGAL